MIRCGVLILLLACTGCGPRRPTVVDPEHPELRHWQMFVDYSRVIPAATQPVKENGR